MKERPLLKPWFLDYLPSSELLAWSFLAYPLQLCNLCNEISKVYKWQNETASGNLVSPTAHAFLSKSLKYSHFWFGGVCVGGGGGGGKGSFNGII